MRIGCFIVPLFPLAARLRSEPELLHEAVVVTEGNGAAARIFAATRRARKEGIRAGMTLAQARALLPRLIARSRDAACERTAQEALLEAADSFSPRVEDAGEGMVYLDLTGMERHFAVSGREGTRAQESMSSPESETASGQPPSGICSSEDALARAAMRAVTTIGLPVRVGIAASKLAARVAAELPHSPTIVPPGEESAFLAPLPLARLSPEVESAEMLGRWGIGSIGDLAKLPEREIASRLGETGRDLHWAARGIDSKPLTPRPLPPEFREGMDLEWPVIALEPFTFVAHAALDRLAQRLDRQGLACRSLELTLTLEPDGFHSRTIDLPAPTRDVKTLLTLLRLDLEASPPGAPVAGFVFVAHPDRPRRGQLSLFGPEALSPDRLATTIARLASIVGEERIGMACTIDGHAPERYAIIPYDPPPPPEIRRQPPRGRGLLAVRVLRPPVRVEVITAPGSRFPPPERTRSPGREQSAASRIRDSATEDYGSGEPFGQQPAALHTLTSGKNALDIRGEIRVASGPWELEEAWWSDEPVMRDYWDVEVGGGVYRLFCERSSGEWFVDGVYD